MLVCFGLATQAHNLNPNCGVNGRISVKGTQFDYAGNLLDSVVLYITTNDQANGTIKWQGSIFVTTNGTFTMDTVPYYTVDGETVFIKEYQRNSLSSSYYLKWTGSNFIKKNCQAMPITLTSWTARTDANDSSLVHLAWSVDMESNVAYYRIDASVDGKTWDSVLRVDSKVGGNTSLKTDYTKDFYNPKVTITNSDTAKNDSKGLGAIGVAFAIGVIAVSMRSRGMIGVACVLMIATIACKKSIDAPRQTTKYSYVRLSNVDNDAQSKTFETRKIK